MEGRPHDERELVLRSQRGDSRAYEELVRPHQEIAFRVAYVITRNAADAEDAAQEALVKAWRALGRFRAGEPMRPWLLRIVANEARNRRRSTGRREQLVLRAAASPGEALPATALHAPSLNRCPNTWPPSGSTSEVGHHHRSYSRLRSRLPARVFRLSHGLR